MVDEPKAKLIARDKAMRHARDQMLRIVSLHLTEIGFNAAEPGNFTRETENHILHIGFQKHTSGRDVRVMAHVTLKESTATSIAGPWNDAYSRPDSPNGIRYNFHWSTRDEDVKRCAAEYCRFIDDVLIDWFSTQTPA
jgi:hypothetical protein